MTLGTRTIRAATKRLIARQPYNGQDWIVTVDESGFASLADVRPRRYGLVLVDSSDPSVVYVDTADRHDAEIIALICDTLRDNGYYEAVDSWNSGYSTFVPSSDYSVFAD